ncbi:MAG: hypothetical protein CVU39_26770 [Chloroflexi bacterium HGW-Chloroflexi-10]|nr:MAG: hypothetical protein CVU39_26770 [Chloroflexi bacterium HGW-Chloroflexi-10]
MIKVGTIFEIQLSGYRKAFGQYIHKDRMGPIIKVFNLITKERPDQNIILNSALLFPPIITGLFAALKAGLWVPIGFDEVKQFDYPGFVSTLYDQKTGEANIWFYWDGNKSIRLGTELQDEFKNKEYLMVWDPNDVVHRIETGEYPFPYKDLILFNKFSPRNE